MYNALLWGRGRPSKLARWIRDRLGSFLRIELLADEHAATRARVYMLDQEAANARIRSRALSDALAQVEGLSLRQSERLDKLEAKRPELPASVQTLTARIERIEGRRMAAAPKAKAADLERVRGQTEANLQGLQQEREEAAALRAWVAELTERLEALEGETEPPEEDRDPRCPSWAASYDGRGPYRCCQPEGHGRSHVAWQEDGRRLRWVGHVSREEAAVVEDARESREPEWRS